jgi:hypothetical protein
MELRANRWGRVRRLGPLLAFGVLMLLIAPARSLPGLVENRHGLDGDGSGGAVVAGDGTGGIDAATGVSSVACQRIMLPIYPSNTEEWDRAIESDMPAGSVLILNQGGTRAGDDPYGEKGGPGFEPDPELQERVAAAQARGFLVIGYIRTGATGSNSGPRRDRAMTDLEIADLKEWYGVDGIMYDEVWADDRYFDYYQALVAHGREVVPGLHVFNSGGSPSDVYASIADVFGTFEGRDDDFRSWAPDSWQLAYPPSKWAASVMSVDNAAEAGRIVWLSRHNNLGYIYMTNRFGTQFQNPWTHLPPYWSELVARVVQCSPTVEPDAGA